jgi:hypothetical protein
MLGIFFAHDLKSACNQPMIGVVALYFGFPQAGQGRTDGSMAGVYGGDLTSIRIIGGKRRHIMMKVQK